MSSVPCRPDSPNAPPYSLWLKRLYSLITYDKDEVTRLATLRGHADHFLTLIMFLGMVLTTIQGLLFNQLTLAILLSGSLFALSALTTRWRHGKAVKMHIQGVLMVLMVSSQIHLSYGMTELHLGFFIIMPVLLLYHKPSVILSSGITIILVYWLMSAFEQAGYPVYLFHESANSLDRLLLHSTYVAFSIGLFSFIAQILRHNVKTSEEATELLSNFAQTDGVSLRKRAQPDSQGKLSIPGEAFNHYIDHIALTLSTFKMLSLDIRELNSITKQLKSGGNLRFEQVNEAAQFMRDFIQGLGKQTAQLQNMVSESNQLKDDCFDLINEVNQAIEQLSRISKQTYEANRDIQTLAADEKVPMSGELRNKLMVVAASLDHLTERTQTFSSRFEFLKSGLNAIDNLSVQIEHGIGQLLENGHNNQRAGWEVLSRMDQLQANAEEAFTILNNTIDTVTRADLAASEMEKRFSRFNI